MPPKAKPVEERYKKHDLRSHILEISDTWVGSVEPQPIETYLYDDATQHMVKREIIYTPALLKVTDEVVSNSGDQSVRLTMPDAPSDAKQVKNIWITANKETGRITVTNDGDGIDIEMHPEHKVWIPTMIFGQLLSSSNYNQSEEKLVVGRNGVGANLANIFSSEFTVETVDHRRRKIFYQRWFNNMAEHDEPIIKAYTKTPFTRVSFTPDYPRFGMKSMTDDMFALFRKRAFDLCATTAATVSVYFNEEKLETKTFERYTDLYLGDKASRPRAYEASADGRWEVVATYSENGQFDQVSFVNGTNTYRGGKHVEYIANQIAKNMVDIMAKKKKSITPQTVKANLMVFVKASIVNPAFDSQSKETLTTPVAKFGSKFDLSDKFMANLMKTGIGERASNLANFQEVKAAKKNDGKKTSRVIVPKLDDANDAGTKHSQDCTLILTEGDSAATLATAGLSVVGRDRYGVFPLKGKILNVKDAAISKISDNEEITNLKKILGLQQGRVYTDTKDLRYGRVMLMTDADHDGSHIKGLLFNLFQSLWPSLYKIDGFTVSLLTPIVTVSKKGEVHDFYNLGDFNKWLHQHKTDSKTWTIKYKKGLATSTSIEAKKYFENMHLTTYIHTPGSDEAMDLAFNKKRADNRKEWLMNYDREVTLDYTHEDVAYDEFVHKELIHYSNRDLERSINHMCDGLKESTRKILFGCFKRKLFNSSVKVAQLAAYVSEHSAYHHGEASLQQAITGMAQNFVGTNNINLLVPDGQFGSRKMGGADAGSPRYIFTLLSSLAKALLKEEDMPILQYQEDDGVPVEPTFYIPIIPMVLVNGAMGIGTGFSTNVPQFNPSDVISQCMSIISALDKEFKKPGAAEPHTPSLHIETDADFETAGKVIDGMELPDMVPYYLGFTGSIVAHREGSYMSRGVYRWLDDTTIEITELPIGVWTLDYIEYLKTLTATTHPIIKDVKDNSTDQTVCITLDIYPGVRRGIEGNFDTEFKLVNTKNLSLNNIHLYNAKGAIHKYKTPNHVLLEWAHVRLRKYMERKAHQLKKMEQEYTIISAKVRFIQEIIADKLKVMNKKIKEVEAQLIAGKYPAIVEVVADGGVNVAEEIDEDDGNALAAATATASAMAGTASPTGAAVAAAAAAASGKPNYAYLTKMPINQLTFEKKQKLEKEASVINMKIIELKATPIHHIWRKELTELSQIWEAYKTEREEEYRKDREMRKGQNERNKRNKSAAPRRRTAAA